MTSTTSTVSLVDRIVQTYGDLLFDLCESVLWSPSHAQLAFRAIIKEIRRNSPAGQPYQDHERAWVLKIACRRLAAFAQNHTVRMTPSEQIMLDATLNVHARLKQFDSYFHRLSSEDQILMLLRDKYGLPYPEIATALGVPEGSLKVRRQQALRTLEEWLWEPS